MRQEAKNDSFLPEGARLQSPQRAIAGAKAERPFPERSPARSADGGSPESHAPAGDSGEPETERKGLNGARIAMIRRPTAGDPGRGVRLGQDRPGEASASTGSPGRQAAVPVFRFSRSPKRRACSVEPPIPGRRPRENGTVSREESEAKRSWPCARAQFPGRRDRRGRDCRPVPSPPSPGVEPGSKGGSVTPVAEAPAVDSGVTEPERSQAERRPDPERRLRRLAGRVGRERRSGGSRGRLPQAASPRKRQLPGAILPGPEDVDDPGASRMRRSEE